MQELLHGGTFGWISIAKRMKTLVIFVYGVIIKVFSFELSHYTYKAFKFYCLIGGIVG
jgi:hypothetical protein